MRYLLALLLFSGCSSLGLLEPKPTDPLYTYKADIVITMNATSYGGFAWAPLKDRQVIGINSKANLNLLQISSCHRSFSVENVDPDWFGGVGKSYNYTYDPTPLERKDFCPVYIQAFDKQGTTAWGFVAFQSEETLPFNFQCNGKNRSEVGVSVCQAQINQVQGLTFNEDVRLKWSMECKIETQGEKSFIVSSKGGFCIMTAYSKADPSKFARVLLLGYKQQHVR